MRTIRSSHLAVVCLAALLAPEIALAEVNPGSDVSSEGRPTRLFLETDPTTFPFRGFAAHLRVRPSVLARWSFGAGAYALSLPKVLVELDPTNRDKGWSSRITIGTALFVDRYLRDDGEGPFVGVELGVQRFRVTRDAMPGEAGFTNLLVMPRLGYFWRPLDAGFYVLPWIGVGVTARVAGDVRVGDDTYNVFPIIAFATIHVGWQF